MNFTIKILFLIGVFSIIEGCQGLPPNNQFTHFKTKYQWSNVNFTWPSHQLYKNALINLQYIPENVIPIGLKLYENRVFIATPHLKPGVPATLSYIAKDQTEGRLIQDPLLTPYPSWTLNTLPKFDFLKKCPRLISVYSLSIDQPRGTLWAIDGERYNDFSISTQCPCKLILIDLKNKDKIILQHVFSEKVCLKDGGFLNDIVVEDGKYAYISDASNLDPGIVVYSRAEDRSHKIRGISMFARVNQQPVLHVGKNDYISEFVDVNGIALSPLGDNTERFLYYTALGDRRLFSVSTDYLKRDELRLSTVWKRHVVHVGDLQNNGGDGMLIDTDGYLYYALITENAVGRVNIGLNASIFEIYDRSNVSSLWNIGFAIDESGFLYLSSFIYRPNFEISTDGENNFFISQVYTGTKNYQH